MFNSKLAQSVQRDYRQAADNHRMVKNLNSEGRRFNKVALITTLSGLVLIMILFF